MITRKIILKFRFINKLPRKFAKKILLAFINFDDLFLKFRIFIFTLIIGKKSKIGKALFDLKQNGVAVIPNFYSEVEITKIKEECLKQLDKLPFDDLSEGKRQTNLHLDNDLRIEKIRGSIKVKKLNVINQFFKKVGRDFKTNLITLIYTLSSSKPFLVYSVTHDGSFNHKSVPEPCTKEMIAGEPHLDTFSHELRFIVPLEEVTKENGPTICYKGSMHLKEIKEIHLNMLLETFKFKPDEGGSHFVNKDKTKLLEEKFGKTYLTGNKGDLILLDLKTPHYASNLKNGQRHILWYYY